MIDLKESTAILKKQKKKFIIFFALFFSIPFLIVYIQARIENRNSYHFVITRINDFATLHFTVSSETSDFNFCNFNSFHQDIEIGDSLVKRAFSKKLYIYRKDPISYNYKKHLELSEAGNFPIDWQ